MSVPTLKTLLKDARAELTNFVSHSEKWKSLSEKTMSALAFSQKRLSDRISEFLTRTLGPLNWRNTEPGTWHAHHNGLDVSIYKEAGRYYWQISCTDDSVPGSFEDAEEMVSRLIGLE